jgi:hypothetical protein
MKLNLGDCVIVKQGVKEPDLEEFEIGGWQGRIVEIDTKSDKDNILITIEWDSFTLKQIPSNYIEQSEREGFDWQKMTLYYSELEKTKPRDKKENVKQAQDRLSDKHQWDSLGGEGIRISKVLDKVNPHDEMKCLQKWVEYLDNELSFPIHAIVSDSAESWLIKCGERVIIKSLPHIVDMYGIIASIRINGKKCEFPLCDLKAIDKTKADFQLIDDYRTWFANR